MAKENSGHKNLKPAKKGEVRNPKGRPKGRKDNATLLKEALVAKKEIRASEDPRLWLFDRIVTAAIEGKPSEIVSAAKEAFDRIDGKSVAKVEQTVKGHVDYSLPGKYKSPKEWEE